MFLNNIPIYIKKNPLRTVSISIVLSLTVFIICKKYLYYRNKSNSLDENNSINRNNFPSHDSSINLWRKKKYNPIENKKKHEEKTNKEDIPDFSQQSIEQIIDGISNKYFNQKKLTDQIYQILLNKIFKKFKYDSIDGIRKYLKYLLKEKQVFFSITKEQLESNQNLIINQTNSHINIPLKKIFLLKESQQIKCILYNNEWINIQSFLTI